MAEILPDGSMQGYSGYCPRCKEVVAMNIQGDILNHVCKVRPVDTLDWDDQDIIDVFGEDYFEPCSNCDLPDACADFGCAIKSGIRKVQEW